MTHIIPFDIVDYVEDDTIDMSITNFDDTVEDKIRSAFIFIRNTDLAANYDFSNCSYEQKAEYLKQFMFGTIDVNVELLRNTWMEILLSKKCDEVLLPCIFNEDEISRFVSENINDIHEVYELIVSTPIFAIYSYLQGCKGDTTSAQKQYDSYEETDYEKINLHNFSSLTFDQEDFVSMIKPDEEFRAKRYTSYLQEHQWFNIMNINNNLPYLKLLYIIYAPKDERDQFISALNEIVNKYNSKEVDSDD